MNTTTTSSCSTTTGKTCVAAVAGDGSTLPWFPYPVTLALADVAVLLLLFVVMLIKERRKPAVGIGSHALSPNYGWGISLAVRTVTSIALLLSVPPLIYYAFYYQYDAELACTFVDGPQLFPLFLTVLAILIIGYFVATRRAAMDALYAGSHFAQVAPSAQSVLVFPTGRAEAPIRLASALAAVPSAHPEMAIVAGDSWSSSNTRAWARENIRRVDMEDSISLIERKMTYLDPLEMPDNSIDLVYTPFLMIKIGGPVDKDKARLQLATTIFQEIHRILKPGGTWILVDFSSRAERVALHLVNEIHFHSSVVSDDTYQLTYKKCSVVVSTKEEMQPGGTEGRVPSRASLNNGRGQDRNRSSLASFSAPKDATRARGAILSAQSWASSSDNQSGQGTLPDSDEEGEMEDWELFPSRASLELAVTGITQIPHSHRLAFALTVLIDMGMLSLAIVAVGRYFRDTHLPKQLRYSSQASYVLVQALGSVTLFQFIHLLELIKLMKVQGGTVVGLFVAYIKSVISMFVQIIVFQVIFFLPSFLFNYALVCSVDPKTLNYLTTGLSIAVIMFLVKGLPPLVGAIQRCRESDEDHPPSTPEHQPLLAFQSQI